MKHHCVSCTPNLICLLHTHILLCDIIIKLSHAMRQLDSYGIFGKGDHPPSATVEVKESPFKSPLAPGKSLIRPAGWHE